MLQQLCERNAGQSKNNRRRYFINAAAWFCFSIAMGSIGALFEYRDWFPPVFCRIFPLSDTMITECSVLRLSGVLLSSTMAVPMLFGAGLHPVGYQYTARGILLFGGFFHGVDVVQCLWKWRESNQCSAGAVFILMLWTVCVGCVFMRVHATATAGVRAKESSDGPRPFVYWSKMLEYWGALMILRIFFYVIYTLI